MTLKTWILGGLAAVAAVAMLGCDQHKIDKLEEGLSTEMDVMKQFGTPADITREADGSRIFEYPRQPEGFTNYFITIGPDGKMSALRQALHPVYFAKVTPGMELTEVRRLLGLPAVKQFYDLKKEGQWEWRWQDGSQRKVFWVMHDAAGKVLATQIQDDPREFTQNR